ncbi:MAG: hypothetical protein QXV70_07275 [Saccharolobus sp.]
MPIHTYFEKMKRKTTKIVGLVFIILGIAVIIFTYIYSSLAVYSIQKNIFLAENSAQSYLVSVKTNDIIFVHGNSTKPIDVYIISFEPQEVIRNATSFNIYYNSPISGNIYVQFRSLPFTNLTTISFEIVVYNSWISGIGYLSSGLLLLIGLLFMGYYILRDKNKRRGKKL